MRYDALMPVWALRAVAAPSGAPVRDDFSGPARSQPTRCLRVCDRPCTILAEPPNPDPPFPPSSLSPAIASPHSLPCALPALPCPEARPHPSRSAPLCVKGSGDVAGIPGRACAGRGETRRGAHLAAAG